MLVDSVAKKVRFLRAAIEATGVDGRIGAETARAEGLARDPRHREAWPAVTARAVAPLAELVELGLPTRRAGRCPRRMEGRRRRSGGRRRGRRIVRAAGRGGRGPRGGCPGARRSSPGHRPEARADRRPVSPGSRGAAAAPALTASSDLIPLRYAPSVRVAVLSDIHSNVVALEAVLAVMPSVDEVWQLGDVVGYGPEPDAVVTQAARGRRAGRARQPRCGSRRQPRRERVQRRRPRRDPVDRVDHLRGHARMARSAAGAARARGVPARARQPP